MQLIFSIVVCIAQDIYIYTHVYIYIYIHVCMCACVMHADCAWKFPGDLALQQIPSRVSDIRRVQAEQSFEITDLGWISAILCKAIRLTIHQDAYPKVSEMYPGIPKDMVWGQSYGQPAAHLLFSWQKAVEEERVFGHFDILAPIATAEVFSLMLISDETLPKRFGPFIYIYIYYLFIDI